MACIAVIFCPLATDTLHCRQFTLASQLRGFKNSLKRKLGKNKCQAFAFAVMRSCSRGRRFLLFTSRRLVNAARLACNGAAVKYLYNHPCAHEAHKQGLEEKPDATSQLRASLVAKGRGAWSAECVAVSLLLLRNIAAPAPPQQHGLGQCCLCPYCLRHCHSHGQTIARTRAVPMRTRGVTTCFAPTAALVNVPRPSALAPAPVPAPAV